MNGSMNVTLNKDCSDDGFVPDEKVFINSIYVSLAAAPGNIWSIAHMDKLGRKFFLG